MILTDQSVTSWASGMTKLVRSRGSRDERRATARRPASRAEKSAARREAILAAALDEFSAQGFAAARLDDVARRAGVAKGTIYLHFRDKEQLFQELIRAQLKPFAERVEAAFKVDLPMPRLGALLVDAFMSQVYVTRRKDVIRLILAEGHRFPKLAEFYYREVLSHVISALRDRLRRAREQGEISSDAMVRFPQLLAAPVVVAIIWDALFERFEPLDVRAMLRAHFDLVLGAAEAA
jgi:AcrR family transcriptional regulator